MLSHKNYSLKSLNTFGIPAMAAELYICNSADDIKETLIHVNHSNVMVLGGGSNMLFISDIKNPIIHPQITGIEIIDDNELHTTAKVGAGVVWDDFVAYCVNNNLWGVENLSLIPGHVGASPVQNIGAYGVEAGDCIEQVHGIFIENGNQFTFGKEDCNFGYRNSIFKQQYKGKCIITHVEYKLSKNPKPILSYGHMSNEVETLGGATLSNIRQAVINIRTSKLPDPAIIGNGGSFFKNPEVENNIAQSLKEKYENIALYPIDNETTKVPAGWLIEQAGWKGYRRGDAGVHEKQALVLVNYGNATGSEVLQLANDIQNSVSEKFGINLEMEINVMGNRE